MELGELTALLLRLYLHTYTYIYMKCLGHDCGYPDHLLIVFTNNLMVVHYTFPEIGFQFKIKYIQLQNSHVQHTGGFRKYQ